MNEPSPSRKTASMPMRLAAFSAGIFIGMAMLALAVSCAMTPDSSGHLRGSYFALGIVVACFGAMVAWTCVEFPLRGK